MVAETNFLGQIVRHLEQLKQALESQNVIAHVNGIGRSGVALQIADLPGDVTCRSNPTDAHHLWFWHNNEPLTPAGSRTEAREAAAKLLELRSKARGGDES
ncbi:hypothetical protein GCM10027176_51520 [Actinoallomurus bryophytorum]|uniref:Uncharacterized protein n=1 Tax=Actinoallomurus bryophytorum TaxID=1490222 RepID=A0A543CI71_9ACTN|nr:hypothetical protein [Actinoallomurus bryophytorum]TQL96607.1 hypothetical protein FB559_2146 [Actinoallomurus bryophytorum]